MVPVRMDGMRGGEMGLYVCACAWARAHMCSYCGELGNGKMGEWRSLDWYSEIRG